MDRTSLNRFLPRGKFVIAASGLLVASIIATGIYWSIPPASFDVN